MKVEDVNDNNPVFEQHIYQGHIPDNSEVGTEVLLAKKIIATDADILDAKGVKIEIYGKDSEKFRFDAGTGGVFLSDGVLSRSTKEVYYLRLRATDSAGQVGEGQLVIHVTDRKNHQPKFLKLQVLDSRLVSVAKDKVWVGDGVGAPVLDMAETVPPGTRIARVLAEDPDTTRNNGLVYSLVSELQVFKSNGTFFRNGGRRNEKKLIHLFKKKSVIRVSTVAAPRNQVLTVIVAFSQPPTPRLPTWTRLSTCRTDKSTKKCSTKYVRLQIRRHLFGRDQSYSEILRTFSARPFHPLGTREIVRQKMCPN